MLAKPKIVRKKQKSESNIYETYMKISDERMTEYQYKANRSTHSIGDVHILCSNCQTLIDANEIGRNSIINIR
jgi:hypothetical protein